VAQRSDCKGILESKGVADGRSARGEGAGEHSSWMGGRKGRWKAGWKVDRSNYDLYNGISRGRAEEPRASYPSPLDPFSTICGSRDYRCPSRPTRPAEVEKSFTTRAGPPPPRTPVTQSLSTAIPSRLLFSPSLSWPALLDAIDSRYARQPRQVFRAAPDGIFRLPMI
jgi:hypothetical protein